MKIIDCKAITDNSMDYRIINNESLEIEQNLKNILTPSVEILNRRGVIVYPTDTIYALGVNAFEAEAVEKIPKLKNRPFDMPISVAVADLEMLEEIAVSNPMVRKIYKKFLPGALTMLLDVKPEIKSKLAPILISETNKIGIRIPEHVIALALIKYFGQPLTATSANIHNMPVPIEISTSIAQLGNKVDLYLDCGTCTHKGESTIVDISEEKLKIIREGVITRNELVSKLEVPIDG